MAASVIEYTPLTTILLYGEMRKFGRMFRIAVRSPAEAIKALCVQIPGFEKFLMQAHLRGIEFAVFRGKRCLGEKELEMDGSGDIRIAPVLHGRKRGGVLQTIVGAVLIVVGYVASPFTGGASMALVAPGVALMAGGVIQMMSPQPKGLSQSAGPENMPSYAFGSARNTTASGNPVPLCIGERRWGGAIISAGIYAEDQA